MTKNKMNLFITAFVKFTGFLPALLFFKPKLYTMNQSIKKRVRTGTILMSNHTSLLDFVLYLVLFPLHSIQFLMAEVLYNKGKVFAWFLYKIGGIFVNRDACNFSFIEDSKVAIDKKRIVGVFPQGRLPIGGKPFPFKSGVVLIALATGAAITPIYTDGNYGIFKRAHVMIGEEIEIARLTSMASPDDAELKRLTQILEDKTYAMKAELEKRINSKNG